jgi:predicted RNase H-like nuclease (RuvC/YqgF family)
MQTITLQVKDDLVAEVMNALKKFKDNVKITKDKNLELDPYFYERREKLHKIMDKIDNDKSKLTNFDEFKIKMDKLEKELEEKYAN